MLMLVNMRIHSVSRSSLLAVVVIDFSPHSSFYTLSFILCLSFQLVKSALFDFDFLLIFSMFV